MKAINDEMVLENSKGISNLIGSFILSIGLIYFVIGYEYYSINYLELILKLTITTDETINMFIELGKHLTKFIIDGYTYIMNKGVIDFTIYKTFYHYFWDWKISALLLAGTYLKVSGTPIQRIKKIIGFSVVFFLVLLIKIPIA